jgi:hypothetical protein
MLSFDGYFMKLCYPYGEGITCVCDGAGRIYKCFPELGRATTHLNVVFVLQKTVSFKAQREVYFSCDTHTYFCNWQQQQKPEALADQFIFTSDGLFSWNCTTLDNHLLTFASGDPAPVIYTFCFVHSSRSKLILSFGN